MSDSLRTSQCAMPTTIGEKIHTPRGTFIRSYSLSYIDFDNELCRLFYATSTHRNVDAAKWSVLNPIRFRSIRPCQ